MNPTLTAFLVACAPAAVAVAAVAFGTWKVLKRIGQAVEHLEQHQGEQPEVSINLPDFGDGQLQQSRSAMDPAGFFAPNRREGQ